MAIILSRGKIKVIAFVDTALDDVSNETYDEYSKSLDESKLKFHSGQIPTRFVLDKVIDYKKAINIKNKQVSYNKSDSGKKFTKDNLDIQVNMGTQMMESVRAILVDIEHPPGINPEQIKDITFKKGTDGLVCKELMALLDSAGIVTNLYYAFENNTRITPKKK